MTHRTGVKPIPTAHYFAILDRHPRVCIPEAANENEREVSRFGLVIMVAVAVWVFGGAFVVERFL